MQSFPLSITSNIVHKHCKYIQSKFHITHTRRNFFFFTTKELQYHCQNIMIARVRQKMRFYHTHKWLFFFFISSFVPPNVNCRCVFLLPVINLTVYIYSSFFAAAAATAAACQYIYISIINIEMIWSYFNTVTTKHKEWVSECKEEIEWSWHFSIHKTKLLRVVLKII